MKLNTGKSYEQCQVTVLQHVKRVCVQFTSDGQKAWITGDRDEIRNQLQDLIEQLQPQMPTAIENRVEAITPQGVIAYFYASPVLAAMAGDVEKALGQMSTPEGLKTDLEIVKEKLDAQSLFVNGELIRGGQSRIADALNIPNAGSYRKRVLTVQAQLERELSTNSTGVVELLSTHSTRLVESNSTTTAERSESNSTTATERVESSRKRKRLVSDGRQSKRKVNNAA